MYQFFCDSNCELWHTTVKELGLNVIRMPYVIGDDLIYYDMGENTDFTDFYNKMRSGVAPKTAALNDFDYTEYFEPVLARGEDSYYLTFSHQMSGTFNAMKRAIDALKEKYPDREIRFKDSKNICMGAGMTVYYAALKYKDGATMDELDAFLDDFIPHVATYFVVDDLTYLHRGGRISGAAKFFGGLLGIKPIIHVNDEGTLINIAKGKGRKALSTMRDFVKSKGSELDKYKMFVLNADNEKGANEFVDSLRAEFGDIDIVTQPIGPVIGSHCGPGTVACIFHAKER